MDGRQAGDSMVRGHCVIDRCFGAQTYALNNVWFATGDVATIGDDGYMQITDRSKRMIESGGGWISIR
ncbi:AMP-binding protein [Burkholderia pseudomultivorans]|uniref:AMP-binding protein n=1 Tax=Burkholderia pseudomultivorans TaxID=1207504 RepID=UPI002875285B|nr:AMP-binding protein [Burkholderia pseudomultivorans]MDS0862726.1 AMP-binding protein [Burkholderia pseudomultivorans]